MAFVPAASGSTEIASTSKVELQTQEWCLPEGAVRLSTHLTLRDGATVAMRAIRADDKERLQAFHARLSLETVYLRFFSYLRVLTPQMAEHLTHVDYENRMALVATTRNGSDEQIVADVRYDRAGPAVAEVAFVVEDAWQGHGIATPLLYRLAAYARGHGIMDLVALTMSENIRIHTLLCHSGFPASVIPYRDMTEVRLDISRPPVSAYAQ